MPFGDPIAQSPESVLYLSRVAYSTPALPNAASGSFVVNLLPTDNFLSFVAGATGAPSDLIILKVQGNDSGIYHGIDLVCGGTTSNAAWDFCSVFPSIDRSVTVTWWCPRDQYNPGAFQVIASYLEPHVPDRCVDEYAGQSNGNTVNIINASVGQLFEIVKLVITITSSASSWSVSAPIPGGVTSRRTTMLCEGNGMTNGGSVACEYLGRGSGQKLLIGCQASGTLAVTNGSAAGFVQASAIVKRLSK